MLIYDHNKEFIGIDASDLQILGFSNLEELKIEVADFADMFVKAPGFVHNFKHVNWIDFVTCADSTETTKVLIHANSRNFRCLLDIKTVYLTNDPSSKAFLVYLNNIRELSNDENEDISDNLIEKTIITPTPVFVAPQETDNFKEPIKEIDEPKELNITDTPIELDPPLELNFQNDVEYTPQETANIEENLENDLKIDLEIEEESPIEEIVETKELTATTAEVYDNGYTFDPQVASDELGLPVDLIEEFIEDFIAQAKEFKDELYSSLTNGDTNNLKILSHKLKGVAANLRIEDALEDLTIINSSENTNEIKKHLDILYKIISKLSGETISVTNTSVTQETVSEIPAESIDNTEDFISETTENLDLDIFTLPEEPEATIIEEDDTEEALRINIPELADDNFLDTPTPEDLHSEPVSLDFEDLQTTYIEEVNELKTINYDTKLVASEIGLSQENFMELFQDYLEEAQILLTSISNAVQINDATLWKRKAIQLKGMNDNMRIDDFTAELETLIQTDDEMIAKDASSKIANSITLLSKIEG